MPETSAALLPVQLTVLMATMLWMSGLAYHQFWKLCMSSQHKMDIRGLKKMMQHPLMQSCWPRLLPHVLSQMCWQHLDSSLVQVLL